jgi:hypothetical protein
MHFKEEMELRQRQAEQLQAYASTVRDTQRAHEDHAARAVLAEYQELALRQSVDEWQIKFQQAEQRRNHLEKV